MAATIFRYDNAGHALGILPYDSATHDEALDGTDKLTVVSEISPTKRDRLVWQDDGGYWHEHMVDSTKRKHGANGARTESTCSNSINELYGVIVNWTKIRTRIEDIIATILSGTTWYIGDCSNFGIVEMELYHKSARECLAELCELVHGELETFITVGNSGVTRRYLRIVRERGNKSVMRQFQYGRNVSSIMREVAADEVYTAVKGYGAKLFEYDTNEYPTRLEAVVNSNMDLSRWGVPKGDGTFAHNYTTYTDSQCTDRTFLTKQCKSVLDSVSKPLVRYEFDTADVGGLWSDVRLGDRVMCIDELFNPPLELVERVSQIRRNLKGRVQCRIAIGARTNPLIDQFKAAEKTSKKSTGNGSRISSRTPTTTRGAGYDGEGAAGIGDVPTPTITEPSKIAVTTPPNKTEYYDGENIDYTGIVVTLYNSDNSVYTDDWHPDGVAAFEELSFPQEVAVSDGRKITGTATVEDTTGLPDEVVSGLPLPFISATSLQFDGIYNSGTKNVDRIAVANLSSRDDCYSFVMASETHSIPYIVSKEPFNFDSKSYNDSGQYSSHVVSRSSSVIVNGSSFPIYWNSVIGSSRIEDETFNVNSITVSTSLFNYVAYVILYGTRTYDAGKYDIPVKWTRSDSTVLSSSFEIVIKDKPYDNGESWRGGEGDVQWIWGDPHILYPELYD